MICFGYWPIVAKRSCIKDEFRDVHALFHVVVHSVHARCLIKCLLDIFSLVWIPMSTKLWGFSCFLTRIICGSLIIYLTHFTLHVHCMTKALKMHMQGKVCYMCIFNALVMQCTQSPLAHTFVTFVMYWSIPCFFILACHIYLMLCSILFCLLFELHFSFILHPSCIILLVHVFISCPIFSLTPLSIGVKKGKSILKSFCHFFMALVHILRGRNYFSCTHLQGEKYSIGEMHIPRRRRH